MVSGEQIVPGVVGLALIVLLIAQVATPLAGVVQGTETVELRQREGETSTVFGPIQSTPDTISQNPNEATVTLSNNETSKTATGTVAEGSTITLSVGDVDVDVTLVSVHSSSEATFEYQLPRSAFVDDNARPLLGLIITLLFLAGMITAVKVVVEIA